MISDVLNISSMAGVLAADGACAQAFEGVSGLFLGRRRISSKKGSGCLAIGSGKFDLGSSC